MRKTRKFGFLLTDEEKALIVRLAELYGGLSQAFLIRQLVRNEARKYGILPLTSLELKHYSKEDSDV